jgi:hypothetical protein
MTVIIKQDGKQVAEVEHSNAAFEWLLRHQGQSVSYAMRYGGYTVTDEQGHELPDFAEMRKRG